jgi:hypothetical protein
MAQAAPANCDRPRRNGGEVGDAAPEPGKATKSFNVFPPAIGPKLTAVQARLRVKQASGHPVGKNVSRGGWRPAFVVRTSISFRTTSTPSTRRTSASAQDF